MARIPASESKIAVGMGSTFGTAVDLTASNKGKLLHVTNFSASGGFDQIQSQNIGGTLIPTQFNRTLFNGSLSMGGECTYSGMWLQVLAAFLGTATASPAEQTGSQGDYLHNLDLTSKTYGKYMTLAWLIEDDYALEIPSFVPATFELTVPINGPATWSTTGLITAITDNASVVNSVSDITGLSYPTEDPIIFGASTDYLRMNAQAGAALDSSMDYQMSSFRLSLARSLQARHVARGANTKYSLEFDQLNKITGQIVVNMTEINDAVEAGITNWLAASEKKAELYVAGDLIGSTLRRSIKLQIPRMRYAGSMPAGHDIQGASALMAPVFAFDFMQATAAPTGMTGVTVPRLATTSTRIVTFLN